MSLTRERGWLVTTPNQRRIENLSKQMLNTLVGLARGMTYAEIAQEMGSSERNVKFWAERLVVLLDVSRSRRVPYAYYQATGINPYDLDFPRPENNGE